MKFLTLPKTTLLSGVSAGLIDKIHPKDVAQNLLPGLSELQGTELSGDTILIPDPLPGISIKRLVVLIPDGEIEEKDFAKRIWLLASGLGLNVFYLALSVADPWEAYQRRRAASLAHLTSGYEVRAHAEVSNEKNWQRAYGKMKRPGDLIVCLEGAKVTWQLLRRRSLGALLAETTGVPVYMMSGVKAGSALPQQQRNRSLRGWIAAIILIGVFFGLQVAIDRASSGMPSTILQCLSVFAEISLLWKINDWIG